MRNCVGDLKFGLLLLTINLSQALQAGVIESAVNNETPIGNASVNSSTTDIALILAPTSDCREDVTTWAVSYFPESVNDSQFRFFWIPDSGVARDVYRWNGVQGIYEAQSFRKVTSGFTDVPLSSDTFNGPETIPLCDTAYFVIRTSLDHFFCARIRVANIHCGGVHTGNGADPLPPNFASGQLQIGNMPGSEGGLQDQGISGPAGTDGQGVGGCSVRTLNGTPFTGLALLFMCLSILSLIRRKRTISVH